MNRPSSGSLVVTLLLGAFVLACLIGAPGLPPSLRIATNMAGYATIVLIGLLVYGHFRPQALKWAETALQDVWGGKGTDARSVGLDEGQEEAPTPPAAVARAMGYAIGFLALSFLFGFYLVPPLFIACYLTFDARVKPLYAILTGIGVTAILIGGMRAVNVDVWVGTIPEVIPQFLGGSLLPPV